MQFRIVNLILLLCWFGFSVKLSELLYLCFCLEQKKRFILDKEIEKRRVLWWSIYQSKLVYIKNVNFQNISFIYYIIERSVLLTWNTRNSESDQTFVNSRRENKQWCSLTRTRIRICIKAMLTVLYCKLWLLK